MLRISKAEPLSSILEHNSDTLVDNDRDIPTDAELADLVRERVETTYDECDRHLDQRANARLTFRYHPTSTVKMAPLAKGGCVNPYLQIYGIPNLRVADASIMPTIIRCAFYINFLLGLISFMLISAAILFVSLLFVVRHVDFSSLFLPL
jgi:choline dehydrogenase